MTSDRRSARAKDASAAGAARAQGELAVDLMHAVAVDAGPQAVCEIGLGGIAAALGAARAALLLDASDGGARVEAWRGLSERFRAEAGGRAPWAAGLPGPIAVVADDEDTTGRWAAVRPAWRAEGIGAAGFLPLRAKGRLLGACAVYYAEPRRLAAGELASAQALADHVAAALTLARSQAVTQQLVDELADEKRILEAVGRIGGLLAAELDLERLLQILTDEATAICGAEFGAFFYNVVSSEGETYMLYTLAGAPKEAFARFGVPRKTPVFAPTFAGEDAIRLDDVTKDPRYGQLEPHRGMPEGHLPVTSYLAVPVVSRSGRVHGGLFFGHSAAGRFTEVHERVLVGVASQAAIAIDNAQLFQEAERALREEARRGRHVALVAEVGLAIAEGGTAAGMLERCCAAVVEHLDAAFARIWTLDPERDVLVLRASAGLGADADEHEVPVGELEIGRVAAERRPYLDSAVAADPDGLVAYAIHPLLSGDRLVGALALAARQPLEPSAAQALASVSSYLAVGLDRLWADEERTRLLEAERSARDRAEAAARSRDEIVAIVSHDLRNPLTSIVTSTALLEELVEWDDDAAPARRYLETIQRQSQQMNRMIGDLLDVASIESGALQVHREPLAAAAVLDEIVATMQPVAEQKGLRLAAEVDEATPALFGDRERLLQVLSNLVGNALKFTETGGITVRASPGDDGVCLEVCDTGPGIPADQIPFLFDRFWRARPGRSGVGLGLAISRGIVEAHGGRIWAESELGEGTSFRFTIPRAAESPANEDRSADPADTPTVLLVDDDDAIRETLAEVLEHHGFAVESAENGQRALELLRGRIARPAVIVLDLMMPVMDGRAFRAIQADDPDLGSIPVVVFTAFGARAAAAPLGAAAYLEKPVRSGRVVETLREVIRADRAAAPRS